VYRLLIFYLREHRICGTRAASPKFGAARANRSEPPPGRDM